MSGVRKRLSVFFPAVVTAATAAFLLTGVLQADVKVPVLELRDTRLPNGLRVILAPDHSAPVYAINVTYNVGSRNERPGRTGFAHLFEHMMFEGSQNVGKGEHFILVLNNGGGMNGTTNEDRTMYFEELSSQSIKNFRVTDVSSVHDQIRSTQSLDCFVAQQPVRIGNQSDVPRRAGHQKPMRSWLVRTKASRSS